MLLLYSMVFLPESLPSRLETGRIDPLTNPCPLRYLCSHKEVSLLFSLKRPSSHPPKHTLSILAALVSARPVSFAFTSCVRSSDSPQAPLFLLSPPPYLRLQDHQIGIHILRIDFRYFFSLRSNTVYLSFGTISASVGISSRHRTMGLDV